ncbi:MAG: hypothetical protein CMP06_05720 [Xanthomonadales bacterium]|nr:hypothetical protein [Xanthomonadales bacterium]
MSISSLGVGSGLDIASLVSQLVSAERGAQDTTLARRSSAANAELSALGRVRSSLNALAGAASTLEEPSAFTPTTATSADEGSLLVSSTSGAQVGSYNARVVQLASAHKLHSQAHTDAEAEVGYGELTLELGEASFSVSVPQGDGSLEAIRDAINGSDDNVGIRASIIIADDGARLVLESEQTGADQSIRVTAAPEAGGEGLDALVYDPGVTENLTELSEARDGKLSIDGFVRSSSTNTITDAVDGLSFTLLAETPDMDVRIDVAQDSGSVSSAVQSFVTAYNNAQVTLSSVSLAVPGGTSGALVGDPLALGARQSLRTMMTQQFDGDIGSLSEVGISFEVDGTMQFDASVLEAKADTDLDAVIDLFSGDDGLAAGLRTYLDGFTADDGRIDAREDSLDTRLEEIEVQGDRLDRRMERFQARLTAQFTAMDQLVASLQSTGSYLTQQLSSLPGFTRTEAG